MKSRRKNSKLCNPPETSTPGPADLREFTPDPDREEQVPEASLTRRSTLTPFEREKLFVAWWHKQELAYVARECGVDSRTASKYRELDAWDTRLDLLRLGAAEKTDAMLVEITAQMIAEIAVLRKDAYLSGTKSSYDNARQAVQSYIELTKVEMDLRRPISQIADSLVKLAGARYRERRGESTPTSQPVALPPGTEGGTETEEQVEIVAPTQDEVDAGDNFTDDNTADEGADSGGGGGVVENHEQSGG